MIIERKAPATVVELAAMSATSSVLYFGVGTTEATELLDVAAAHLRPTESLIIIEPGAGCFDEIGPPDQTPALGAWSSMGVWIGYEYHPQAIAEFMKEARRFA